MSQHPPAQPQADEAGAFAPTQEDVRLARQFFSQMKAVDLSQMPAQFFESLLGLLPPDKLPQPVAPKKESAPPQPLKEFDEDEFNGPGRMETMLRTIRSMAENLYGDEPEKMRRFEIVQLRCKLREVWIRMEQLTEKADAWDAMQQQIASNVRTAKEQAPLGFLSITGVAAKADPFPMPPSSNAG